MFLGDQVRNSVVGANVCGMVTLVCFFHVIKSKESYVWIYTVLSVVILFSVVLTQSRGPLGALLITFLIGAVLTRNKKILCTILCVILIGGVMFFTIDEVRGYPPKILLLWPMVRNGTILITSTLPPHSTEA